MIEGLRTMFFARCMISFDFLVWLIRCAIRLGPLLFFRRILSARACVQAASLLPIVPWRGGARLVICGEGTSLLTFAVCRFRLPLFSARRVLSGMRLGANSGACRQEGGS